MPFTAPNLDYIINAHNYQKIQDCLSEASDMAMLIVDFQGTPVTEHSRCSAYCSLVRSNPELNNLCRKCDARGGLEAARLSKPYIYRCHMGILDLAVPIVLGGVYAGAIMAGQVVPADEDAQELETIAEGRLSAIDGDFFAELEKQKKLLPVMSRDRVQIIANMLFQINNYMIEEALLKIELNDRLEASGSQDGRAAEGRPAYNSFIIRPALDYIASHYHERITLDEMASRCNISSSYFSKLFNKITGETFANYVNTLRIRKACEYLDQEDIPITTIAFNLGFDDISYFDKVFKKIAGTTPSAYKKN
ncbi:PocR ligand-binding domain-containing protein [Treponema zuelzerae]|uniref:PocR ligand-binding domain-containing protein n=1 Tax=Teretinema zuelzerae TaxID=156 RepID=A0AAE3EHT3_9SPIR|nr:PocR ligand-binding domain-containing protein [Teretinema zuelzerae]MCD1654063.1 PocR ligand-binding domain-containing protein [Teretinema zuelzerae]